MISHVARVYETTSGPRVLVDRLWPRGISKEKARATWMKELAPSRELVAWYHADRTRYRAFCARYRKELAAKRDEIAAFKRFARGKDITIVTAAKDIEHSHVPVLLEALKRKPRNVVTRRR